MNLNQIKKLAAGRSFTRGEAYFNAGRVRTINIDEDEITAIVRGQHDYKVTIKLAEDEFDYSCDCPVGDQGDFCKHIVAAGLAFLNSGTSACGNTTRRKKSESTQKTIKTFLELQNKTSLIEMLTNEAKENRNLRERLLLEAARTNPSGVDLNAYRQAIGRATRTGGYVDYHAAFAYAKRVGHIIDQIASLFETGHAKAVIELTEYALAKLDTAIGEMDDSAGHMGDILPELHVLHHRACEEARPDPVELARRLFEWEINSDWDIFFGAAEDYADILGDEGLAEYRRLAEDMWSQLPTLGPGESAERGHFRFRVTSIMEILAAQTGDAEALVEVKRRDLSHAYSFLQIAEIYLKAKKHDKALEWAERGLNSFPRRDPRLVEFLAAEYHRRRRHDEAMKLIWEQFDQSLTLEHYQALNTHAQKVRPQPAWPDWRQRALARIRTAIGKVREPKKVSTVDRSWRAQIDYSLLVEIFLWEGKFDDAWQEACAGGCSESLWLRVAGEREKEHPSDVLPVYREIVATTVNLTNNGAYEEAVKLVRKIGKAMVRLGRKSEFEDYVAGLRTEYKRKRNFVKLLDGM